MYKVTTLYPVFIKKKEERNTEEKVCVLSVLLRINKRVKLQMDFFFFHPSIHPSITCLLGQTHTKRSVSGSKANKKMMNPCNFSLGPVCIHQD